VYGLERLGLPDWPVIITTGWPSDGGPNANPVLASTYLDGVTVWCSSSTGTPKRPGFAPLVTYRQLIDSDSAPLTDDEPWARRWGIYDAKGRTKLNTSMLQTYELVAGADFETLNEQYCVAQSDASDDSLIAAISYACNSTDCTSIQRNASCSIPPNLRQHASIAFNSFFQDGGQATADCNFGGTAVLTKVLPYSFSPTCQPRIGIRLSATSGASARTMSYVVLAFAFALVLGS
jgi:hypothetical protein